MLRGRVIDKTLRKFMNNSHTSIKGLARAMNVDQASVRNWLAGRRIGDDNYHKLYELMYGVSLAHSRKREPAPAPKKIAHGVDTAATLVDTKSFLLAEIEKNQKLVELIDQIQSVLAS